ncbi:TIR domain-containing protein [Variovorax robiniae]|uniref:TIR domain-containing protein n=1 Tax=Variovorax robiniae TaxID=1836199 RepID=A0ABU8XKG9_9BURK
MSYQPNSLAELLYPTARVRRRCFISYHHADEYAVRRFIDTFSSEAEVFTHRALGVELDPDIVNSTDTDYVMRRIRERYMSGTSVTIVMIGRETWGRRYVDWEIAASLRSSFGEPPNGLLGIHLPNYTRAAAPYPPRLDANLIPAGSARTTCYARWHDYPRSAHELHEAIEQAIWRRDNLWNLIDNSAPRFNYNRN